MKNPRGARMDDIIDDKLKRETANRIRGHEQDKVDAHAPAGEVARSSLSHDQAGLYMSPAELQEIRQKLDMALYLHQTNFEDRNNLLAVRFYLDDGRVIGQPFCYMLDASMVYDSGTHDIDSSMLHVLFSVWKLQIRGRNLDKLQDQLLTYSTTQVEAAGWDDRGPEDLYISSVMAESI